MAAALLTSIPMNSKRTRVKPVFDWLRESGGQAWPAEFLSLCEGPMGVVTEKLICVGCLRR